MKVKLPNWIDQLSGYNNGLVFFGYRDKYHVCYARDYVMPTLTANNTTFGSEAGAVAGTTWNAADSNFKADMQTYADAWNDTQSAGKEPGRDLTALNLFIKACFAAADETSFDLSTLTVNNFGGEAGNLLGTESPDVGSLIEIAGLPSCDLELSSLNSPIVAV